MILRLDECSNEIREIIKKRTEREHKKTGYNLELEQAVVRTDYCYIYHMSRQLDYGDYIVRIRNQGDYEIDADLWHQKNMYAYEIEISSKHEKEPELRYRISDLMGDLGRYGELPSWETLKSFFESEEVKQLFMKYTEVYNQLITSIQDESKGDENETV